MRTDSGRATDVFATLDPCHGGDVALFASDHRGVVKDE
jgi:hypothetical protein